MRILVVSQYFWPESFRINEIVTSLVERGIDVTVLTGKPNYPEGKFFKGYQAYGCITEEWNSAHINRVPIFSRGVNSKFRLSLNYLSFIFSGLIFGAWKLRNVSTDLILVQGYSPILKALPALFIGWLKRAPVILYVQDLWPDSIEATEYIKNQFIIGCVRLPVRFIYRHVDLILISSRPFEPAIQGYCPAAKIVYHPNSGDMPPLNLCKKSQSELPVLNEGFSVVFAGNVGSAQAVQVIVEAARFLMAYSEIKIVILGSGSKLDWMIEQKKILKLTNLYLAGRFPVEDMPLLLSRASILLATLADRAIFSATVPNKIQTYMSIGRPIIACMNGEGARLVKEAKAGLAVPAEDASKLSEAILSLYKLTEGELNIIGQNAQSYYRTNFDHEQLISKLITIMEELVEKKQ